MYKLWEGEEHLKVVGLFNSVRDSFPDEFRKSEERVGVLGPRDE